MKESIDTIPLLKAFESHDECPFCFLEREAEHHAISFILGSAYMEEDIRQETDLTGFCRHHFHMMYDYGNRLGSALMLSTHLKQLHKELFQQCQSLSPDKPTRFPKLIPHKKQNDSPVSPLSKWLTEKTTSCYICNHYKEIYNRYLHTFFHLYKKNPEFRELFETSKGFCLPHFHDLITLAEHQLKKKEQEIFFKNISALMLHHFQRIQQEVSWFVDKNDYRNRDKEWGTSSDSVQRAMQKCAGGYPADPVFKQT